MSRLIAVGRHGKSWPFTIGERIGSGGEGEVFGIVERDNRVLKVLFEQRRDLLIKKKLEYMIDHPPIYVRSGGECGDFELAWPEALVYDDRDTFLGFIMPRVNLGEYVPIAAIWNPYTRLKLGAKWRNDLRFLLIVALNVASLIRRLHDNNVVVGDLNEPNCLVNATGRVLLIDCDSVQIREGGRVLFDCRVMKREFAAPEWWACNRLDFRSDDYSLAIFIFLLLMQGVLPLGDGLGFETVSICGFQVPRWSVGRAHELLRVAPPFDYLPVTVQSLFRRCFGPGVVDSVRRPTALEWAVQLAACRSLLVSCKNNVRHVYFGHEQRCVWCKEALRLGFDRFPATRGAEREGGGRSCEVPVRQREPGRRWWWLRRF